MWWDNYEGHQRKPDLDWFFFFFSSKKWRNELRLLLLLWLCNWRLNDIKLKHAKKIHKTKDFVLIRYLIVHKWLSITISSQKQHKKLKKNKWNCNRFSEIQNTIVSTASVTLKHNKLIWDPQFNKLSEFSLIYFFIGSVLGLCIGLSAWPGLLSGFTENVCTFQLTLPRLA